MRENTDSGRTFTGTEKLDTVVQTVERADARFQVKYSLTSNFQDDQPWKTGYHARHIVNELSQEKGTS